MTEAEKAARWIERARVQLKNHWSTSRSVVTRDLLADVPSTGYLMTLVDPRGLRCRCCDDKEAACLGLYEVGLQEGKMDYACSDCCGHGNEDGWCYPVPLSDDDRDLIERRHRDEEALLPEGWEWSSKAPPPARPALVTEEEVREGVRSGPTVEEFKKTSLCPCGHDHPGAPPEGVCDGEG